MEEYPQMYVAQISKQIHRATHCPRTAMVYIFAKELKDKEMKK